MFDVCLMHASRRLSDNTQEWTRGNPIDIHTIPSQWFYGCKTITALEVPATVESIGAFAFEVDD